MMKYSFLLLLLFISAGAGAQTVSASVDRDTILIGEPFHLQLAGTFPQSRAQWIRIDTLAHFEIMETMKTDTQVTGNSIRFSQTIVLTSWDSGKWQIGPFEFGRVRTKPVIVHVAFSPSPFDINQPYHDIRDIVEVKPPIYSRWYWWLILGALVLVLALLFFPKEKKKAPGVFVADEGAYKKAMRRLGELEKKQAYEPGPFYTELVDIFRDYLHRRKNLYSFSRTTDDLAIQMERLQLPRESFRELLQTLRLADLVKFARFSPTEEEAKNSLGLIRESIREIEEIPHAV